MKTIQELEKQAAQVETNREAATDAMIKLARLYGNGEGVPPDLLKAFKWAEKAAYQDSPEGYLEITRIIGSSCIAIADPELKKEYANYVVVTCDLGTVARFARADIAYNVGTVCEYMAQCAGTDSSFFKQEEIRKYIETAAQYYSLAVSLPDELSSKSRKKAEIAFLRVNPAENNRPAFKRKAFNPRQKIFH